MPGSYLVKFSPLGELWIQIREDRTEIISSLKKDPNIQNHSRRIRVGNDGFSLEGSLSWYLEKDSKLAKETLQKLRDRFGCNFSKEVKVYYSI